MSDVVWRMLYEDFAWGMMYEDVVWRMFYWGMLYGDLLRAYRILI